MVTLYGIKNCDTMKKAFDWLNQKGIAYQFHDYKKDGPPTEKMAQWVKYFDIWQLINTKGTTWKQLSEEEKSKVQDVKTAISLMSEQTSVIKRPLVELPKGYLLGFNPEEWEKKL